MGLYSENYMLFLFLVKLKMNFIQIRRLSFIGILLFSTVCAAYGANKSRPSADQFFGPSKKLPPYSANQFNCLKNVYALYEKKQKNTGGTKELSKAILRKYFYCFPHNWNQFYSLFGESDKNLKSGPLLMQSPELIGNIFPMTRDVVGDKIYERRLIHLIMGAQPDTGGAADAQGQLFMTGYWEVNARPNQMLHLLSKFNYKAIEKFWFWVLTWQNYDKLQTRACTTEPNAKSRACNAMRTVIRKYRTYLTPC